MDDGKINLYKFDLDPMKHEPRGYCNLNVANSFDYVLIQELPNGKQRKHIFVLNGKTKTAEMEAVAVDEYIPYCLFTKGLLNYW